MATKFVGKVVSNKMQKSVVVAVERTFKHPKYGKIVRKTKKFMAHDEEEDCNEGDKVRIVSTRPISKFKHFKVTDIISRAYVLKGGGTMEAGKVEALAGVGFAASGLSGGGGDPAGGDNEKVSDP